MSASDKKSNASSEKGRTGTGKARAATSKRGRTRELRARAEGVSDENHSPIIITDGSASVEFDEGDFPLISGIHRSNGFSLNSVEARRTPNGPVDHICFTFTGNARHRIEAVCRVAGNDELIIVEGAAAGGPSKSPTVQFNHQEFGKNGGFPPKNPNDARFAHANRRVLSLRITRLSTGAVVHTCPLVPGGGAEYTITQEEDE
jgi:hypothetical protein